MRPPPPVEFTRAAGPLRLLGAGAAVAGGPPTEGRRRRGAADDEGDEARRGSDGRGRWRWWPISGERRGSLGIGGAVVVVSAARAAVQLAGPLIVPGAERVGRAAVLAVPEARLVTAHRAGDRGGLGAGREGGGEGEAERQARGGAHAAGYRAVGAAVAWYMQGVSHTKACPVDSVQPISELAGDDEEDTALLIAMKEEALEVLAEQDWCSRITRIYWGDGIGGVVAVFLLAFDSVPGSEGMETPVWCVVGDLPPLLLPCLGRGDTPVDVLERYCREMGRWVESVERGAMGEGCVVVAAAPTLEHAEMLRNRIAMLRDDVMPQLRLERLGPGG